MIFAGFPGSRRLRRGVCVLAIGVATLSRAGLVLWAAAYGSAGWVWWSGAALGIMGAARLVLVWATGPRPRLAPVLRRVPELAALLTLLVGVSYLALCGTILPT